PQVPAVQVFTGDGVVVFRPEWAVAAVQIARVVEDDGLGTGGGNAFEERLPSLDLECGDRTAGSDREDVEVAYRCGDFVADHRREELPNAAPDGRGVVIDLEVVLAGDRQLDALAGQRQDALVRGGIAVAGMGQRVYVRVAGNIAGCRHLAANGQPPGQ